MSRDESSPMSWARRGAGIAVIALLGATAIFWLFVLSRSVLGGANHVGWDIGRVRYLFYFGVALGIFVAAAWRMRVAVACIIVCLLSLGGAYAIDTYNVLVPYEVWLKRGLPERGERGDLDEAKRNPG